MPSPESTLQHISTGLVNTPPTDLIDELMPQFPVDAIRWLRHLTVWDGFRGQFPDQAIAIVRIVSHRAKREFGLSVTNDGRVVEEVKAPRINPAPDDTFTLTIDGQPVKVEYTESYFPAKDLFQFSAEKNPLSETGFQSVFVGHDAVEAVGGSREFASAFAEAKIAGQDKEFMEGFEGRPADRKKSRRKVVGGHTAAVVAEREPGLAQGGLFDG